MMGRLLGLVLAAALVALIGTGLGSAVSDQPVTGWWLVVHATAGTVFAVALALVAVGAAEGFARQGRGGWLFWVLLVVGLGQIVTAILPMLGWISSEAIETDLDIHSFFAWVMLAVVVAWVVQWGLVRRRGKRV